MPRKSRAAIAAEANAATKAVRTKALETAAKEIGCEPGDFRAVRLAKLMLADEAMQSLLVVDPARVDFGKMLDIDAALAALRRELKLAQPVSLDLHIVESLDLQECPACKHKFKLATVRRSLEESQHAARELMAEEKAVPAPAPGTTDLVAGAASIRDGATMADHAKMHGPTVVPITAAERRKQALDAAPLARHRRSEPWDAFRAQIPAV